MPHMADNVTTTSRAGKAASFFSGEPGRWFAGKRKSARQVGPIGLDIGSESINLVQLRRDAAGRLELQASASGSFSVGREALTASPAAFKTQLTAVMRGNPFRGRQVISALSAESVRILPVPYEVSGGRSDVTAIGQVLKDRLENDLSRYVIDYMPVRSDPNIPERLALVAVARREPVIEHLELLRRAGLQVNALEIGPSAIKRLIGMLSQSDRFQNHLVINFGDQTSYLTVVSGRRLLQDQEVSFGERTLLDQIGTELDMQPAEARKLVELYGLDPAMRKQPADAETAATLLAIVKPRLLRLVDEINRVLIYTASESRGASVGQIHLLGSLARWRGMESLLQGLVEIPVRVLDNPLGLFDSAGTKGDHSLVIATGLALRGMTTDE